NSVRGGRGGRARAGLASPRAMSDPRTVTPRLPKSQLFIDGKFVNPLEGTTLPVINPATGQKLCDAPAASAQDIDVAVRSARRAFDEGPWRRMNASERGKLLQKLARALYERREEFALVESLNNGKTFKEA